MDNLAPESSKDELNPKSKEVKKFDGLERLDRKNQKLDNLELTFNGPSFHFYSHPAIKSFSPTQWISWKTFKSRI